MVKVIRHSQSPRTAVGISRLRCDWSISPLRRYCPCRRAQARRDEYITVAQCSLRRITLCTVCLDQSLRIAITSIVDALRSERVSRVQARGRRCEDCRHSWHWCCSCGHSWRNTRTRSRRRSSSMRGSHGLLVVEACSLHGRTYRLGDRLVGPIGEGCFGVPRAAVQ